MDEEVPPGGSNAGAGSGFSFPWSTFFGGGKSGPEAEQEREKASNAQFGSVFEEMMREEGLAEGEHNSPTKAFWSLVGGVSGGALGFIVANLPGAVAGAVAGNRLGAVRDARGKSVYNVYLELDQPNRMQLLQQLAAKVFAHAVGSS